ncbi:Calpain-9 (Digestive tract-specific calpain) (New calpain 4) (nCL-4) [Durusdinium trenchii]|uniref:Calpain-9 (Digestive tract-specific calpain) (New calpain 4) (NCL-4) n=1 Tax=Durusdinium trenchii TaxID=1381693 RepID=A0ABP0R900_9DINO
MRTRRAVYILFIHAMHDESLKKINGCLARPSLVEKAYAKACTLRDSSKPEENSGGWLAVGGGGHVEEALVDLTGGTAGRFYTRDVSADRLFLYIYTLQSDTLFVCHVNDAKCARTGVNLNPCACHVINRAATYNGQCFVQVFSADVTGVHDGGLSDAVPFEVMHAYPEKSWDGFFWLAIEDFHAYFDTIIECRLTSSPDVSIEGMPQRLPQGPQLPYMEMLFANPGLISAQYPPEVTVSTRGPCEVIIATQQMDSRITQVGQRKPYVPIILKVYESLGTGNVYSANMVCRSNWIPTRDAMVAFQTASAGGFKVVVEMPEDTECDRLVIRCYSTMPADFMVTPAMSKHLLALPQGPPKGSRFSLVGTLDHTRILRDDMPEPMSDDLDTIRARHRGSSSGCEMM